MNVEEYGIGGLRHVEFYIIGLTGDGRMNIGGPPVDSTASPKMKIVFIVKIL